MKRMLLLLLLPLALVAAACGDDDDAADDATEEAGDGGGEGGDAPVTGPASISADDQSGDGSSVLVASVELPTAGFVVVHADSEGAPGAILGVSDLLPEGESTDVEVVLDEPLAATATVWPMAHVDANGNDEYEFFPPDTQIDVPATDADGNVAMLPIELAVEGGDDGAAGGGGGEGAGVTIAGFAYDPATIEVAVGTTVTWTNDDGAAHTVSSGAPGEVDGTFDESVGASGGTAQVTFDEPGTFPYFCTIHPSMTGEVVVS